MTDHTTSVDTTSVVFDVIVIGAGPVGENATLDRAGRTFAENAGIRSRTRLPRSTGCWCSVLLSTRISAGIAVAATTELVRSGMGTSRRMREASWQERVDALGRAHYKRLRRAPPLRLGRLRYWSGASTAMTCGGCGNARPAPRSGA